MASTPSSPAQPADPDPATAPEREPYTQFHKSIRALVRAVEALKDETTSAPPGPPPPPSPPIPAPPAPTTGEDTTDDEVIALFMCAFGRNGNANANSREGGWFCVNHFTTLTTVAQATRDHFADVMDGHRPTPANRLIDEIDRNALLAFHDQAQGVMESILP